MRVRMVSIFDKRYFIQGATVIESIMRSNLEACITIIALDEFTKNGLISIFGNSIRVVLIDDCDELSLRFRKNAIDRTYSENIFTMKSHALLYVMELSDENQWVLYFDADLYFKQWPVEFCSTKLENYSYILTKHKFSEKNGRLLKYGVFNAGMVGFKKDIIGRNALQWWMSSCDEKCSTGNFDEFYADQGYLNLFPEKFKNGMIYDVTTINQGMWSSPIKRPEDLCGLSQWQVFHFHGFRVSKQFISTDLNRYGYHFSNIFYLLLVYRPYIKRIRQNLDMLQNLGLGYELEDSPKVSPAKSVLLRATFGRVKP
jgi:hypothetical protein